MKELAMTDLEERLDAAEAQVLRESLLARLDAIGLRIGQEIANGVPRDAFADWAAAQDAVAAALEVLQIGSPPERKEMPPQ